MKQFTVGQELPPYTVIGYNYAEAHDNKIHSDDVAAQYGFRGGLVPGVGIYACLTHPVMEAFGLAWLEHGAMTAKFLRPVYDGEEVCVRSKVTSLTPLTLSLELFNPAGILCGVGQAQLSHSLPAPVASPQHALPLPEARPLARKQNLPRGKPLGSLNWKLNLAELATKFLNDVRATLPHYRGVKAVCHPAFYLAQANEILMANVKLGPWIHTGSEVHHYGLPRDGEILSLRGSVAESYEKRGHEIVVLELGLFAEATIPIAHIRHTAIVCLRAG